MKTADRILYTALSLFNEHGENAVTSVDIAMELDISPGNLYYHFKGKEVIVDKLIALHKSQMLSVLGREKLNRLEAEDAVYYLYIIIEKLHLFRFLYRSPADLAEKYPHSHKIRNQVVAALEAQLSALLDKMMAEQTIELTVSERPLVTELMALVLTQSVQYDQLRKNMDDESQRFHCLSLLMMCLLPRLRLPEHTISRIQQGIQHHSIANLAASAQQGRE